MEKFFEVKGTTSEMLEKVILKVGVVPVLLVVFPAIIWKNNIAMVSGIIIASIYLFVFYFKAQK